MPGSPSTPRAVAFGRFRFDLETARLFDEHNELVPGPTKALETMRALIEHRDRIVSKDELMAIVWPDTAVEEANLAQQIFIVRRLIGDEAGRPTYIATIARRGYRFVGHVTAVVQSPVEDGQRSAPATTVPSPSASASVQPTVTAAAAVGEASAASGRVHDPRRWWVGVAAVGAVAAVALVWFGFTRRSEPWGPEPFALRRVSFGPGRQIDPALSPDGRSLVYASDRSGNLDLWLQPLDGGPEVQLTTDAGDDSQPDWAPDGISLVFRSEREGGGLFTLSVADRHVRRLLPEGYAPHLSPDGTRLLYNRLAAQGSELVVAASDGTAGRTLGAPPFKDQDFALAVGWHPSGRVVILSGAGRLVSLQVAAADGSLQPCEIAPDVRKRFEADGLSVTGQSIAWSSDGRELYFTADAHATTDLWRLSVDAVSLRVEAGPARLTTGADLVRTPVTSRHGRAVAYAVARRSRRIAVFDLDQTGRAIAGSPRFATTEDDEASESDLSPDGRTLAFMTRSRGRRTAVLRERDLETGAVRTGRVSDERRGELLIGVRWSPDGTRLAYALHTGAPPWLTSSIRVLDRRSGEESIVTSHAPGPSIWENAYGWSLDGRSLLATGGRFVNGKSSIAWLSLDAAPSAERAARVVRSSATEWLNQTNPSPDGRWIVYAAIPADGRTSAIYVIPATGGTPSLVTESTGWCDKPRWSADGRLIYYLASRGTTFNLWGMPFDTASGSAGAPFQVTHFPAGGLEVAGLEDMHFANMSMGGGRVALTTRRDTSEIWILE
jgi:Tol biopolymer transport system component/DNA-binding winged helix-turn-helix (wHTH) protein